MAECRLEWSVRATRKNREVSLTVPMYLMQRGIGAQAPPTLHNRVQPLERNVHPPGRFDLRHAARLEELLQQHFARVGGRTMGGQHGHRLAAVIEREFGVHYHPAHVSRILADVGLSCQKPERRALERNEAAIAHWKRYRWVAIKKKLNA